MNPENSYGAATNYGGYTGSEMYKFIHNTVLPNLKRSGLNITSCDLVSYSVYHDIVLKTGMVNNYINGGYDEFWLTDISSNSTDFRYVIYNGDDSYAHASLGYGVRPLITVVM